MLRGGVPNTFITTVMRGVVLYERGASITRFQPHRRIVIDHQQIGVLLHHPLR